MPETSTVRGRESLGRKGEEGKGGGGGGEEGGRRGGWDERDETGWVAIGPQQTSFS